MREDVPDLQCRYCFHNGEPDLGWQVFSNGTIHLRAQCRACSAYIQYMPQQDEDGNPSVWVKAAPTKPDQPTLL